MYGLKVGAMEISRNQYAKMDSSYRIQRKNFMEGELLYFLVMAAIYKYDITDYLYYTTKNSISDVVN